MQTLRTVIFGCQKPAPLNRGCKCLVNAFIFTSSSVRLQKKRSTVAKQYSRLRNKKAINYYNATTHMLLYEEEMLSTAVSIDDSERGNVVASSMGLDSIQGTNSNCIVEYFNDTYSVHV